MTSVYNKIMPAYYNCPRAFSGYCNSSSTKCYIGWKCVLVQFSALCIYLITSPFRILCNYIIQKTRLYYCTVNELLWITKISDILRHISLCQVSVVQMFVVASGYRCDGIKHISPNSQYTSLQQQSSHGSWKITNSFSSSRKCPGIYKIRQCPRKNIPCEKIPWIKLWL